MNFTRTSISVCLFVDDLEIDQLSNANSYCFDSTYVPVPFHTHKKKVWYWQEKPVVETESSEYVHWPKEKCIL